MKKYWFACLTALATIFSMSAATPLGPVEAPKSDGPALYTSLGTAFTYQGQLKTNGSPATGNYDLRFILYDSAVGGSQIPATPILTKAGVAVSQGLFTVQLDFGNVFGNVRLFLDIAVRPAGSGTYTVLSPRQEITPAPYARFAFQASNAANAQTVPWTGVTGKPAAISRRKIYVPAGGFGYYPSANISAVNWGLLWKNVVQPAGFVLPRPADWDPTTSFGVTLYFALPTAPSGGTTKWRLLAGGGWLNVGSGSAASGWDSLDYRVTEDAPALTFYAAGPYTNLMKAQSWTAKWSSTHHTWYFGTGVSSANDFVHNPIWHFAFVRGNASGNGESYSGDMLVVAAEIDYVTVP